MENILDPTFSPSKNDEKELFEEQQSFMYAVMIKTLKFYQGQKLVCALQGDAQKIFNLLSQETETSTRADLTADDLMTYVINSHVNDSSWNGTVEGYIIHWQEQVRLLHELGTQKISGFYTQEISSECTECGERV